MLPFEVRCASGSLTNLYRHGCFRRPNVRYLRGCRVGWGRHSLEGEKYMTEVLPAYALANYRITNLDGWQAYADDVIPMIVRYKGEILVGEPEAEAIEGSPFHFMVVLRFPSMSALREWWDSEEYQAIKHLRTENTETSFVAFCNEFVMPG